MNAIAYSPVAWAQLDASTQAHYLQLDALLKAALKHPPLSYEQLRHFAYQPKAGTAVRDDIMAALAERENSGYSTGQEKIATQRAIAAGLPDKDASVYATTCRLRRSFFNHDEPLRQCDVTIRYLPWLRIAPPTAASPLFLPLSHMSAGPAIFGALQLYLLILSVHPFCDGNGRVARAMCNLHLSNQYGPGTGYLPLGPLSKLKNGVYEELMARAICDGDYRHILAYLSGLVAAYAAMLKEPSLPCAADDVTLSRAMARAYFSHSGNTTPNAAPPYFVSLNNMLQQPAGVDINQPFMQAIVSIEQELMRYASVAFALTRLDHLTEAEDPAPHAVTFFINITNKEELILQARELRARHACIENIQFAVITGDAVLDAKILIHNAAQYGGHHGDQYHCPVILHDFPIQSMASSSINPSNNEVTYASNS